MVVVYANLNQEYVKMLNDWGPKMDPWETPHLVFVVSDVKLKSLSFKWDLI